MTGPDSLDAWEWFGHRTFHLSRSSDPTALLPPESSTAARAGAGRPT